MKTRVAERGRTFADRVLPEGVARRIAQNTGWLLAERLARLLGAFAITIWVVRYLGPEDFGLLAYAISITMIAEVTSGLGVGAIVVRELVKTPEAEAELLGSAFALRLVAGLAIAAGALALTWLVDGDPRALAVVGIVLASVPIRALSTFDQAFQARMQSRFSVIARTSGFAVAVAMKVAETAPAGAVILTMLPDTGERYLSSPLFEGIAEDMTDEEKALSLSTPGYHMPDA